MTERVDAHRRRRPSSTRRDRVRGRVGLAVVGLLVAATAGCNGDAAAHVGIATLSATGSKASSSTTSTTPSPTTAAAAGATAADRAVPTSTSPPPVRPAASHAGPGTALAALAALRVKGRAPMTGYERARFGSAWTDTDRNGCDQRNDILRRDLTHKTLKPGTSGCTVMTGSLHDPYTGKVIAFRRTSSSYSPVQIDHVVSVAATEAEV